MGGAGHADLFVFFLTVSSVTGGRVSVASHKYAFLACSQDFKQTHTRMPASKVKSAKASAAPAEKPADKPVASPVKKAAIKRASPAKKIAKKSCVSLVCDDFVDGLSWTPGPMAI